VEKIVDYFPERPEESSFLYLVNLYLILLSNVTPYLSMSKSSINAVPLAPVLHLLMRVKIAAFHNPS